MNNANRRIGFSFARIKGEIKINYVSFEIRVKAQDEIFKIEFYSKCGGFVEFTIKNEINGSNS